MTCPRPHSSIASHLSKSLFNNTKPLSHCCCCLAPKSWLFCDPMDCSHPGSSVCGISQARILQWIAISFSRGSLQSRDLTCSSALAGRQSFTTEPPRMPSGEVCYCSVAKLCSTLWDPMDCSIPGFPVLHCLQEFAQTHVHWNNDAIQPSHPLSPPSSPALNFSQNQGLFQWVSSSNQVAKVL